MSQQLLFADALVELQEGKKITRKAWTADEWLRLFYGSVMKTPIPGIDPVKYAEIRMLPYIQKIGPGKKQGPWAISHEDILGEDWIVL